MEKEPQPIFRKRAKGVRPSSAMIRARRRSASPLASATAAVTEGVESSSSDESGEKLPSSSTFSTRKTQQRRRRQLYASTSKKQRRDRESNSSDESDSESPSEQGARADIALKYTSSGTAEREGPKDMGATARSQIDTDLEADAQSQFERIQQMLKERAKEGAAKSGVKEKLYQGAGMYGAKEREDTAKGNASSGLNRKGPIRASQYMRASVRWDYAPDICKDYKETGFCTFGDSCKFLHDRSDYKHGWELERDWAAGKMNEAKDDEYLISGGEEEDEDQLPHHCYICRGHFTNPVVTKCKHYFCEKCALDNYRATSKKCAVCGVNTDGVFKTAKELIAKIASLREKEEDNEEGAQLPEDDDGTSELKTLPLEGEAAEVRND